MLEVRDSVPEVFIEGHLIIDIDKEEGEDPLRFIATIDVADTEPTADDWIKIDGKLKGIHHSVLGIRDFQMSMVKLQGSIDYDG